MLIREATGKLVRQEHLSEQQCRNVMDEIMSGKASSVQTAAFLAALSTKGETIEEITGCAAGMREKASKMAHSFDLLDIVGTGGDGSNSFNISTTAALVIASAGVKVSKHGNRAATSQSGSADCLEALGVNIHLSPECCLDLLEQIGICFFFAQQYHSSMKYVAPVRKELGMRTIFNLLGPLSNPAVPTRQVLGVYSESLVEPLAHVLSKLGVQHGMVVFGQDGLDEISMSSATTVCEFHGNDFRTYQICPEDFGFERCQKSDLLGGTAQENAAITLKILNGTKGAKRQAVVLNAAAGIYIAGKAASLKDGVTLAEKLIDTGKAKRKLSELIDLSKKECT